MHPMETKTASGATNTESGQTKESEPSVSELGEKVKWAKAMEPIFPAPEPKAVPPLDYRTEIFMLNAVKDLLEKSFIDDSYRLEIIFRLISKCAEANGI